MRHYCFDWDGMTVDETTPAEMSCCTCFDKSKVSEAARQTLDKNILEFDTEMEAALEKMRKFQNGEPD